MIKVSMFPFNKSVMNVYREYHKKMSARDLLEQCNLKLEILHSIHPNSKDLEAIYVFNNCEDKRYINAFLHAVREYKKIVIVEDCINNVRDRSLKRRKYNFTTYGDITLEDMIKKYGAAD